jgi:hypothetical protein
MEIATDKTHAQIEGEVFSPFYIIGWITIGTGLLLLLAVAGQPTGLSQAISLGSGLVLCLLGYGLYRLHGRFLRREELASVAKDFEPGMQPTTRES